MSIKYNKITHTDFSKNRETQELIETFTKNKNIYKTNIRELNQ